MKTLKLILIIMAFLVNIAVNAQEKKDLCQNSSKSLKYLGGYNVDGSLHVFIYDNTNMQVYRYINGQWLHQWYGSCSKSFWLYAGGESYSGNGSYFQGNSTLMTTISNTNVDPNTNELVLEKSGKIRIKQITYYPPSSEIIYLTYEITNLSDTVITDFRLFSGGDTFLYAGDNGAGFWLPVENTVGVKKTMNNSIQRLYMEGKTVPYAYESRSYWAVYMSIISNGLTNIIDENEGTDNGMALEYRTSELAPGETWKVETIEKFSSSPISNIIVTAPLSGQIAAGAFEDINFTIKNRTADQTTATLIPTVDLAGWMVELISPSSPFDLPGNATKNVKIRVYCPIGTLLGTTAKITLSATDGSGIASDYCNIIVIGVPQITEHPSNQVKCEGQPVTFKITANNAGTYQWQEYKNCWSNIIEGGIYSGTNTYTLDISSTPISMDNYKYRCIATNAYGNATSNNALLSISSFPTIISQPSSSTICEGYNTNFVVLASGAEINYQWQVNKGSGFFNITDLGIYSGATTNTLNITAATNDMNGYEYQCVLSGICNPNLISDAVLLTVNSVPIISGQPLASSTCEGNNTSFEVEVAGTGITYQWQYSADNGSSWYDIEEHGGIYSSATSKMLGITGVTYDLNGYQFRCFITGTCDFITSESATLTVHELPDVDLGNDTILLENQTITLDAGPGIKYIWSNPLLNGQVVTVDYVLLGTGTHNISVTVTNSNNCENSDSVKITYVVTTGLYKNDQIKSISISPNPTSGVVFINFSETLKEAEIEIFNMQGKLIMKENVFNNSRTQVNMGNYPKGPYIIRIISDNQTINQKQIVK